MTLIKSISGIRGTIGGKSGDNLTPLDAVKFGCSYGHWLKKKSTTKKLTVVIGRDARISGKMIQNFVQNSLISIGAEVIILNVDKEGKINLEQLKKVINEEVAIVAVMLANNEIGVIQPLQEISKICKEYNVWLHSDAAQALGNVKVNVNLLGVDLLSISSHKVYGPKGMGCLYVRRKPRIRLISQIDGGGQERLMRSGTLPTPLIVGF